MFWFGLFLYYGVMPYLIANLVVHFYTKRGVKK
jgi:hypothetical protein